VEPREEEEKEKINKLRAYFVIATDYAYRLHLQC
jgi:hypothetical protein